MASYYFSSSTKLNEIQNHDDFQIVWFDLNHNISTQLENFAEYIKKFNSFEECDKYILKVQSERKILLVLIDLFQYASYFNCFPQIQSIYALKSNHSHYKHEEISKLIDIFTDQDALIQRLRQDILLTFRSDFSISITCSEEIKIQQTLTSFDKTKEMFLWNHAFTYYLVNSPDIDMNKLKNEMIEQCKLEYENYPTVLPKIEEFSNTCTYDNVIRWYTEDAFVYRLVNRAFRTRNVDLICKFRYFIILLYRKLKELSIQKQRLTMVYRGQIMQENELEMLKRNVGHFISISTLMSTTRDQQVARDFVFGAPIEVIFKINVTNANNETLFPFADILELSSKPDEKEVLFFPGAVFHIDSIKPENNSRFIIELTLKNETFKQIEQIITMFKDTFNYKKIALNHENYLQEVLMKTDDFNLFRKYHRILTNKSLSWIDLSTTMKDIDVSYLFSIMGNYEKLIEYYKQLLLKKNFMDKSKFIVFNILIGNNYSRLFDYYNALLHYAIAFSLLDNKNLLTGELYHHIGDVWTQMNNFRHALLCYEEALKILNSYGVKDRYNARIYRRISYIYQKQNNDDQAIIYKEQADQLDTNYRRRSDLDYENSLKYYENQLNNNVNLTPQQRADMLYSMGLYFIIKGNYDQALKNLLQAKQLFTDNLPSYDGFANKFASIYYAIAYIKFIFNKNFEALIMWKKAIDIMMSLSSN